MRLIDACQGMQTLGGRLMHLRLVLRCRELGASGAMAGCAGGWAHTAPGCASVGTGGTLASLAVRPEAPATPVHMNLTQLQRRTYF